MDVVAMTEAMNRSRASCLLCCAQMSPLYTLWGPGTLKNRLVVFPTFAGTGNENAASAPHVCMGTDDVKVGHQNTSCQ